MPVDKDEEKRKPSDELLSVLARNIRALRKLRGLSQEKLGERCGCHPTFVSMVERKQRNITISTLELFAEALRVDAYQLLNAEFTPEGDAKSSARAKIG